MRILATIALIAASAFADTPQQHVHSMSHEVMPFDMAKTIHVFKMTTEGGEQRVEARAPVDSEQVAMIRQHLGHEAAEFAKGNFGDPAYLHGATMPGLAELSAEPKSLKVSYADVPNGGKITFEGANIRIVTAIHRWFGAQLSEHGADATAE
jgi:hypothetical protein